MQPINNLTSHPINSAPSTTAFYDAVAAGNREMAQGLLDLGATLDIRCGKKQTALHIAAMRGHTNIFELFQGRPDLLNSQESDDGYTPLHVACLFGKKDAAISLLQVGADPAITSNDGSNALHHVVEQGQADLIELFRGRIDLIDARRKDDRTALFLACHIGERETFGKLLDIGANLDVRWGKMEFTPIHLAAKMNQAGIIELCKDRKDPLDAKTADGSTALHIACTHGNKEAAKALLDMGANCEIRVGENEFTALHIAATLGHANLVELFAGRPSLDAKSKFGPTALICACAGGHEQCVAELLKHGCSLHSAHPILCEERIMNVFFRHQQAHLSRCVKSLSQESSFEQEAEIIRCLLDQNKIRFLFERAFPIHERTDVAVLHNSEQCSQLIDHVMSIQAKRVTNLKARVKELDKEFNNEGFVEVLKLLGFHHLLLSSLQDTQWGEKVATTSKKVVKLFSSTAPLERVLQHQLAATQHEFAGLEPGQEPLFVKKIDQICDDLERIRLLHTLLFQKVISYNFTKHVRACTIKYKELRISCLSRLQKESNAENDFDEMDLFGLLTQRYGINLQGINSRLCWDAGLIEGRDLRLLGIDNTLFQKDTISLQAALATKKNELEAWRKKDAKNKEDIGQVCKAIDEMQTKLAESHDIEKLQLLLKELDRKISILLIDTFISEKKEIIKHRLGATSTESLSAYVKKSGIPFTPQDL